MPQYTNDALLTTEDVAASMSFRAYHHTSVQVFGSHICMIQVKERKNNLHLVRKQHLRSPQGGIHELSSELQSQLSILEPCWQASCMQPHLFFLLPNHEAVADSSKQQGNRQCILSDRLASKPRFFDAQQDLHQSGFTCCTNDTINKQKTCPEASLAYTHHYRYCDQLVQTSNKDISQAES